LPCSSARGSSVWVVKLGGSLARRGRLGDWLALLAHSGGGRVVLVPGGGPFADVVREAQLGWGFDDRVAHVMALLAMEQHGQMLCGLAEPLLPARDCKEIRELLDAGKLPVWLPGSMVDGDGSIPASWDISSDSLAAWLAARLDKARLVLVKSARISAGAYTPQALVQAEMVDAKFAEFALSFSEVIVLGDADVPRLAEMLRDPEHPANGGSLTAGCDGLAESAFHATALDEPSIKACCSHGDSTVSALAGEVLRLRDGISTHQRQTGHAMCWLNDVALWRLLEPAAEYPHATLPVDEEFLTRCRRYYQSRIEATPYAEPQTLETLESPPLDTP